MRIKKLEVVGFKSFAERARLHFGAGVTGVVGPNGCGKSNVVDAIRWCMGEMSAKHLRGRAMQDVIFAGSDSVGPQGMAEVTLTFDNEGPGAADISPYAEVSVTRRLYRDGQSEYLLNRVPVRLRDVTDLFLGTGVGTRAYSIIEQGRIGFVVNARPEERRSLIEEVAGITKFKARKKAAERRMEATEQNLVRVDDIIGELERQLGSLLRQAKKAKRFTELRAEQRDLELHDACMKVLEYAAIEKVQTAGLHSCRDQMDEAQQVVAAQQAELAGERAALQGAQSAQAALQGQTNKLDAELSALQRDLVHWEQAASSCRSQVAQHAAAHAQNLSRQQAAKSEVATLETHSAAAASQAAADATSLAGLVAQVDGARAALRDLDERLEASRRAAMQHVHGAAKERSLALNLQRQHEALSERMAGHGEQQAALAARAEVAQGTHVALADKRAAADKAVQKLEAQLLDWRQQHDAARAAHAEGHSAVSAAHKALALCQSRLASLTQIAQRLDGYSSGVKTLLGAKSHRGPWSVGLQGVVAQLLEVPSACEHAIEAVLGDRLQYILVDDAAAAQRAIVRLRQERGGCSGFMLPQPPPTAASVAPVPNHPGVVGPALSRVQAPEQHQALLSQLLGGVLLVDTLQTALDMGEAAQGWLCVSLQGEVLEPGVMLRGGSDSGAGLLAHRREVRELGHKSLKLEQELAALQKAQGSLEQRRAELEQQLGAGHKAQRQTELDRMALAKDVQAAQREAQRLQEELQRLVLAAARDSEAHVRLQAQAAAALRQAEIAESGQGDAEAALGALQQARQSHTQSLGQQQEQLTTLKVKMAAAAQRAAAAEAAMQRATSAMREAHAQAAALQQARHDAEAQAAQLQAQLEAGRGRCTTLQRSSIEAHDAVVAGQQNLEQTHAALQAREADLAERRQGSEALHAQILACTMAQQKLDLQRDQLCATILERHDVALLEVLCDYHMRPPLGAAELARKDELERQIRSIGSINLAAIDECASAQVRHDFLVGQRADLQQALTALHQAIGRINRASRERFGEAFAAVNAMFTKVYPRLFRGGEARLELVETGDLLEAGVDIVAMPPGKKLQNVGLLSGGEKALTATALVFSIFLIKPSPFCILDEVDAPLDEANVSRFNEMLREIASVSQFIVITHNKTTMLQADKLYGITMEEPGCSKVVAVDLTDQSKATQAA